MQNRVNLTLALSKFSTHGAYSCDGSHIKHTAVQSLGHYAVENKPFVITWATLFTRKFGPPWAHSKERLYGYFTRKFGPPGNFVATLYLIKEQEDQVNTLSPEFCGYFILYTMVSCNLFFAFFYFCNLFFAFLLGLIMSESPIGSSAHSTNPGDSSGPSQPQDGSPVPSSSPNIDVESLTQYDVYMLQSKRRKTVDTAKLELDHYLAEEAMPKTPGFDVLNWWKSNAGKYPILQAMARDMLAIPVSSVASESAFSASGRLVSPHRSRLHPDTMEALMCAQSWLWALEMKGETSSGYATIYDDLELEDSCVTRET